MKIQIDTTAKTITIEENVLFKTLMNNLNSMFPNKEWKSFTLVTTTYINNWTSPFIVTSPAYPMYPTYPWITYDGTGTITDNSDCTVNYNTGTYNIEIT